MTSHKADAPPSPDPILQLRLAFWGSKTLLSAVELGLFTELAMGLLIGASTRRSSFSELV